MYYLLISFNPMLYIEFVGPSESPQTGGEEAIHLNE